MRNRNSVFDMAGLWARIVSRPAGTRADQVRQLAVIVMIAALACAGPFAVLDLFNASSLPFFVCICLAVSAALASLFIRQQRSIWADCTLMMAFSTVAVTLSVASHVPTGPEMLVGLAATLYGLAVIAKPFRLYALVPLGVTLSAATLIALAEPQSAAQSPLAFTVIAACAAIAVSIGTLLIPVDGPASAAHRPGRIEQFDALIGAILQYDASGQLVHVSDRGALFFACRPYELMGGGLFERIHILDRPSYAKSISDLLKSKRDANIELRVRDDAAADGTVRYKWVELALAAKADDSGPVAAVGVMRDISARKQVEDDLRASRALAEEASEAKTRFLATIGHELRTPLNAIVGFSDMMAEGIGGTLSPTHQDYTGHIRQSGHHLLEVVNMLLDMSRIDAGKFELQAEPFSPLTLIEPCLQMVEQIGRERNVAVKAQVSEQLPLLVGDERACRQIMINLLSNAIKFSHDDGVVLLAMRRQGKMLAISVNDTGIGMAQDTVKRIGEPFLQAQDGLARRYEGTGLGLSIVKGLVGLHGGRMTVASEMGMGTRITVFLPLDGPGQARPMATIEQLHKYKPETDEQKWQDDEKRSAMS